MASSYDEVIPNPDSKSNNAVNHSIIQLLWAYFE